MRKVAYVIRCRLSVADIFHADRRRPRHRSPPSAERCRHLNRAIANGRLFSIGAFVVSRGAASAERSVGVGHRPREFDDERIRSWFVRRLKIARWQRDLFRHPPRSSCARRCFSPDSAEAVAGEARSGTGGPMPADSLRRAQSRRLCARIAAFFRAAVVPRGQRPVLHRSRPTNGVRVDWLASIHIA